MAARDGETRLHRELPRVAARPGQHLVRLRVVELMRDGVPLQLLAGPQGDHADVADDHRAAADSGVAYRRLAALDAIDEVLHLVGRPAVVHLRVVLERLRKDPGVAGEDRAAADEEGTVLAQEEDAVLVRAHEHGAAAIRAEPLL